MADDCNWPEPRAVIALKVFAEKPLADREYLDDVSGGSTGTKLGQGPTPGTRVVTTGAAELFGTEFGVGK